MVRQYSDLEKRISQNSTNFKTPKLRMHWSGAGSDLTHLAWRPQAGALLR